MNILKFRVWEPIERKMYCPAFLTWNGDIEVWKENIPQTEAIILPPIADNEPILMQFTGLVDKNGVEICENDYVRNETGRICEVVWFQSSQYLGWDLKGINSEGHIPGYSMWDSDIQGWEVIGNRWNNHEFLGASL